MEILRIKITDTDSREALEMAKRFLSDDKKHLITTPNPEIILASQKDVELFHILNKSDLSLPDGIGLKFAALMMGKNITRVTGSDFLPELLSLAESESKRVGIFIWNGGLSGVEDVAEGVRKSFPRLDFMIEEISREDSPMLKNDWKGYSPEIIFVGVGSPWQEKIAYGLLHSISSVKISMVVGGSFDFICGKQKRAPRIFRAFGLEWLWRLIKQPSRWRRIYNAVIKFSLVVLKNSCIRPFFYRRNVVGFVFDDDEVLLLKRSVDDGWSLPQGGVEKNESDECAIKREMMEEIGNNDFEVVKYYEKIYQFKWPKNYGQSGYKGQRQTLFFLKYIGDKNAIKISSEHKNFKWVKITDLVKSAQPVRAEAYNLFLEKFKELR